MVHLQPGTFHHSPLLKNYNLHYFNLKRGTQFFFSPRRQTGYRSEVDLTSNRYCFHIQILGKRGQVEWTPMISFQTQCWWLIEQILKEQLGDGARGSLLSAKSIQWIFNRAWQLQLLQFNLKDMLACNVMPVTDYIYIPFTMWRHSYKYRILHLTESL